MTQAPAPPEASRAADEAAVWFARLQEPKARGDDWRAFEAWLRAAPANAEAYERLEALWVELDEHAAALSPLVEAPARDRRPGRASATPSRRAWLGGGLALAAAVAAAGVGVALWREPAVPATIYETAKGETRQIVLADGTRVHLNAASKISVRFERRARRVEMADAEAAFDVAHDPRRPFLITVGDRQVKVVGTEFNLRRRDGQTVLTVRRGVVEVTPVAAPDSAPTRVPAGRQLVHRDGGGLSELRSVTPDAAFAWTTGRLVYRGEPLSQVAGDLSRRFATPVRVADPVTGRIPFTGVLVLDHEADVIRRLQAYAPVHAEQRADVILLHGARP